MTASAVKPSLAVTGIGLVTPAGIGTKKTWERVCSGRPTAAEDPDLAGLPVSFSCRVPDFDPRLHTGTSQPHRHDRCPGLQQALRLALSAAGALPQQVSHINAHGTSTPLNDQTEAGALRRLFGADPPSVTSAKGVLGHPMGAAGAIEAALTALTVEHQLVPPTANFETADLGTSTIDLVTGAPRKQTIHLSLSTSCGFGGHNTVLAFRPAP